MMSQYNSGKDIKKMIDNYVAGTATAEEIKFVEAYYAWMERNQNLQQTEQEEEQLRATIFENIVAQNTAPAQSKIIILKRFKYAAVAAVLLLGIGASYIFIKHNHNSPVLSAHHSIDIAPGTNKAILTLDDGKEVVLDDKSNGELQKKHGLTITKTKQGQLVYTVAGGQSDDHEKIANNTVTTPKGGQYQVVLPDGTQVWLDAASSLTYPVRFTGAERVVKLQGEGYFEVAKNKAMPFHVLTGNQDVEVTGTHFNINSYMDDNAIKTTLLEGSVTVHNGLQMKKIVPGEQALVFDHAGIEVRVVNTDEETAWKNGLFQFNNSSLKNILNQLERWYDIRIDYAKIPFKRYNGMVPRNANLSEVLNMLELTGNIKFHIDPNRHLQVISN